MNYTDAVAYCKTRGAQWGLPDFQNFTSLLAEFMKEKNVTSIWLGIHKVILPTWTWTTGSPFLSKNNLFWKIKITVLVKRVIKYPRIDQCNSFFIIKAPAYWQDSTGRDCAAYSARNSRVEPIRCNITGIGFVCQHCESLLQ